MCWFSMIIFCNLQGRRMGRLVAPKSCNHYWQIMSIIMMCLIPLWLYSSMLPTLSALSLCPGNLNSMFWLVRYLVHLTMEGYRLVTNSLDRVPETNTGDIFRLCTAMPPLCVSVTIRGSLITCPAPRGGRRLKSRLKWRRFLKRTRTWIPTCQNSAPALLQGGAAGWWFRDYSLYCDCSSMDWKGLWMTPRLQGGGHLWWYFQYSSFVQSLVVRSWNEKDS